jgi:hypothetical protein
MEEEPSQSHSNEEESNIENSDPNPDTIAVTMFMTSSSSSNSFVGSTTSSSRRSYGSSSNNNISRSSTKRVSKHEQRTITNVILSCLRTTVPSSVSGIVNHAPTQQQQLHYYTGFHDLTALIMVNVESLSISSLLLYVTV